MIGYSGLLAIASINRDAEDAAAARGLLIFTPGRFTVNYILNSRGDAYCMSTEEILVEPM
jgi:hypothetical protein